MYDCMIVYELVCMYVYVCVCMCMRVNETQSHILTHSLANNVLIIPEQLHFYSL